MCYDHFISNVDPDRSWLKIHSFLLLLLSAAPYFCLCLHAGCWLLLLLLADATHCTCLLLLKYSALRCLMLPIPCCCVIPHACNYEHTLESLCITNHPPCSLTQQDLFRPNLALRQTRLYHKTKGPTSWELQRKGKRWFPPRLFPTHQSISKGLRAIDIVDFHCTSHVDCLVASHK